MWGACDCQQNLQHLDSLKLIQHLSCVDYWDKKQQSKAQNLDSKYRQMALAGFDT